MTNIIRIKKFNEAYRLVEHKKCIFCGGEVYQFDHQIEPNGTKSSSIYHCKERKKTECENGFYVPIKWEENIQKYHSETPYSEEGCFYCGEHSNVTLVMHGDPGDTIYYRCNHCGQHFESRWYPPK